MSIPPGSVWLDARGAQSAAHGERGIPRYVAEQARALVETAPELIGSVAIDPAAPPPPTLDPLMGSGLLTWHTKTRAAGRTAPGTYHVMSAFEVPIGLDDIWPAWIQQSGSRLVVTLYDLIPIVMRDRYLADWKDWATAWVSRLGLVRSAHQVLTISRSTAEDAMEHLNLSEDRVTVIDSGVSGRFASLVGSRAEADALIRRELPKVRPGFLLYVGGPDYRKNLDGTIRAYSRLPEAVRSAHQLVIACNLDIVRRFDLRSLARQLGIPADGVLLTGFVPDRLLAALYRSCELFVFPSLYEGAGLPILEAMSCGAPVASSNTSAMPELLGDLEGTFDPADPDDMARTLGEVLASPERLTSLRERSRRRIKVHTWAQVAKRTVEGYERAQQVPLRDRVARHTNGGSRRKRLAVVTPWPAQPAPSALHSKRLVAALAEHADVDVIATGVEAGAELDSSLAGTVEIRTGIQFEWLRDLLGYDRCLYVLDVAGPHAEALELMMRVPGVTLAHDVRLLDLYRDLHRRRYPYDPLWLEDKLVKLYGERMPLEYLRRIPFDEPGKAQRVTMTQEVQAHAQQLVVHSRHQAELLRLERPRDAAPVELVSPGIPMLPPAPDGAGSGDPLVVATGIATQWPKLLEAFAQSRASVPGARLQVLGELEESIGRGIAEAAGRLGIAEAVELPGELDDDAYWRTLHGASLALQLADDADGGRAQQAVCDLIAARVPAIVSEVGWQAELPVPVVLPIAPDCSAAELGDRISSLLEDERLAEEARSAQDRYARENSFERVAERYAELLLLG
jgi:glycosyltransferase involved in cell wall biosynthesis